MKRVTLAWVLACLAAAAATAPPPISAAEYKQRRETLRKSMGDGVLLLFGATEEDHGNLRSGFFQEANFYYLTGWTEPGAALVLTPKSDVLLLPRRSPSSEIWTGPKADPADPQTAERTGFSTVEQIESLERLFPQWLSEGSKLYGRTSGEEGEKLRRLSPLRQVNSAAQFIFQQRMKKSPAEIAWIQYATDVAVDAHLAGWKRTRPGVSEYQIAAAVANTYFDAGCQRHAYSPIAGSGKNSTTLHYSQNVRRMDAGDVLLVDMGPECSMYASDLTRTVPVNGKWTKRQRELYDIVLGAQKAAFDAAKPGILLGNRSTQAGLHKIVVDYFEKRGLAKYFTHSLGHHVGLDVHDPADPSVALQEGMVITLEPGLYIPEEGIGIRIEDMGLITKDGAQLMSEKLPRDAEAVERAMAQSR